MFVISYKKILSWVFWFLNLKIPSLLILILFSSSKLKKETLKILNLLKINTINREPEEIKLLPLYFWIKFKAFDFRLFIPNRSDF